MKKIIKYVLIFVIGGLVLSSCEEQVSNFDAMTNDYDKNNPTYYIQFLNATGSFATEIDEAGQPTNIVTTVGVALLGAPQSSDITVALVADPSSTLTSSMYTLSSSSITIPAGGTSGSVALTTKVEEMPEDEDLHLVLNMDAGGAEASSSYQLDYVMKRIKFCPLDDLNTMVGTYGGSDDWGLEVQVVTSVVDDKLMIQGLNHVWIKDMWGETILDEVPVELTMNPNGTLSISEQYIFTTDYEGSSYVYNILDGTGIWDNCKKTLIITYDIYNETDGYALSDYGYAPITETLQMK